MGEPTFTITINENHIYSVSAPNVAKAIQLAVETYLKYYRDLYSEYVHASDDEKEMYDPGGILSAQDIKSISIILAEPESLKWEDTNE